jgi:hypothetical protein
MKEFWDQRYTEHASVYGEAPNQFFKVLIDRLTPGNLLLPFEGEGRNALYSASAGWEVHAFDFSQVARDKALIKIHQHNLKVEYELLDAGNYRATKHYDLIACIFVHLNEVERRQFNTELIHSLKPDGHILIEAFSKNQLRYNSGGPKDGDLLYSLAEIQKDFENLEILYAAETETILDEGAFHQGKASVVRLIAKNSYSI